MRDIKTYHEDMRNKWIDSSTHRNHFLGRSALDMRWLKDSHPDDPDVERWELLVDMSDFARNEIEIQIDGNVVVIHGEKDLHVENTNNHILDEEDIMVCSKKFILDRDVSNMRIMTRFSKGVLRLRFDDRGKKSSIKSSKSNRMN
ncbi:MAG: Hsp20/alpha crystallin family protein [Saprospiraceae bacterium]|nr:Hsp20/alpha crystallin family protein [Saprospiraceae bacterium]